MVEEKLKTDDDNILEDSTTHHFQVPSISLYSANIVKKRSTCSL